MFSAIEKLARGGTLLVTVCKEDELALRVGVTQVPTDTKVAPKLRPLSLVGTAAELDAGFAEAVAIWQAPRKTLAEQAHAAAGEDEGDSSTTAVNKQKATGAKRGPKPQAEKLAAAASAAAAVAAADAAGAAAPTQDEPAPDKTGTTGGAAPAAGSQAVPDATDTGGGAASAPGAQAAPDAEDADGGAGPALGAQAAPDAEDAGGGAGPAPSADGAVDVFTLDLF